MQRHVYRVSRMGAGIARHLRAALAGIAAIVLMGGPAALAAEYRLGSQDRVRIYVSEWPALTGELAVGPNGNVSLPVIGEIPAQGLLPAELAGEIANRLRTKMNLRQLPDASVDIVAYRPFYILGSVSTPGEYAYRPGMLVLNALSLGGGIYRSERISEWDLESTAINSRGQLKVLELRRADLTAEEMRYQAQADGLDTLPNAPATASADVVNALEEQRRLFDAARETYRNERETLQTMVRLREGEIVSLSAQLTDVETKLIAFEEELGQARRLAAQKLAVHRVLPLERDFSDIQREKKQTELEKLRAERALDETRARIAELDGRQRTEALAGLQRVKAEIRAVEEQFSTTSRLLAGAASYSDRLEQYSPSGSLPRLRFTIVRTTGERVEEIPATETTPVVPGDIIKVDRDPQEKSS